jgi:putative oxidoreductase
MLLAFRLYLAKVFFYAGLSKIANMESTLMLFEYEYSVPLIPFDVAAYLSTFVELVFPVLLVIGLSGRLSAGVLFVLNIVAAISYPDISPGGLNDHYFWGSMLLVLVMFGPGKLSIDAWIRQRFFSDIA